MKPNTTFTLLSHDPLFIFLRRDGNMAKMVKGRAKATLNASMVTIGVQNSPAVDLIRTVPTIGPVQENETRTSVRAMKNIPPRPPLPALASLLLARLEGSSISKAPKNEAANTMNTMKKMMFGNQWVASQLNMSAVTALPPISQVKPVIIEIGTVYSSTMKSPYMKALKRPSAGLWDCFMKKEMVIGTMGNTQGVRSMANPHRIASMISAHKLPLSLPLASPEDNSSPRTFTRLGREA